MDARRLVRGGAAAEVADERGRWRCEDFYVLLRPSYDVQTSIFCKFHYEISEIAATSVKRCLKFSEVSAM